MHERAFPQNKGSSINSMYVKAATVADVAFLQQSLLIIYRYPTADARSGLIM